MASPAQQAQANEDPDEEIELDEALTNIGLGWGQGWSMCVMSLLWFGENMQLFVMFYLPQALKDDWKLTESDVAWLDSFLFFGVALGALVGGICSDYFGRKPTVLWSAFLASIFGFYNAYVNTYQELSAIRFVLGLALGAFGPASMSTTLETCPQSLRGKFGMGIPGFSGVAGKIAVALLADSLYDPDYNTGYLRFSWRAVLVLCAFPTFLGLCLGVYVLSESPRWLLVMKRKDEAEKALVNLALKNSNSNAFTKASRLTPAEEDDTSGAWMSIQRVFQQPLLADTFKASMALTMFSIVYYGLIYVLPLFLRPWAAQNGWSPHEMNMGLVIVACAEIPAVAAMIYAVDLQEVGRRYSVVVASLCTSLACVIINFHVFVTLSRSSFGLIGSNFLARGFAQAALVGATLFVAEIFPTGARGAAISVAISSGRLGASVSPLVANVLVSHASPGSMGMWEVLDPLRVYIFYALVAAAAACFFLSVGEWDPAGEPLPDTAAVHRSASAAGKEHGGNGNGNGHGRTESTPLLPRK